MRWCLWLYVLVTATSSIPLEAASTLCEDEKEACSNADDLSMVQLRMQSSAGSQGLAAVTAGAAAGQTTRANAAAEAAAEAAGGKEALREAEMLPGWLQELQDLGDDFPLRSWPEASQYARQDFTKELILNSEVDAQLAYSRTGSDIPSGLHGIFWLDQFHNSSIAQQPSYKSLVPFKNVPSHSTLVGFSEAPTRWDPEKRCVGPLPYYGGPQGHWTFTNTRSGQMELKACEVSKFTLNFCFEGSEERVLRVDAGVRLPMEDMWLFPPKSMFQMRMEKEEWGWNRITTIGPNASSFLRRDKETLSKYFPEQWMAMLEVGDAGAMQYPVLQIVDGNGRRTQYYSEFMAYINGERNDFRPTQLVGVEEESS